MSSTATTAKILVAALRKAYKADRANAYILPKPVRFFFRGITPAWHGTYYTFEPQPDPQHGDVGSLVTLHAYGQFDASGNTINNGATFAPDGIPGAKEGAAGHDPAYLEMSSISAAWKNQPYNPGPHWGRDWVTRRSAKGSATWTSADVRQMFDDILGDAMVSAGAGGFAGLYHSAVRLFGGLFRRLSAIIPAIALLASTAIILSGCSGCHTPRDVVDWIEGLPGPIKVAPVDPVNGSPTIPASSDAVPYASLTWRISRTQPAIAAPPITAEIRKGKLYSNQLTFSWVDAAAAGQALGSSTHTPAQLRAYIFYGGQGGFFDWCSVTRSQRDFNNLNDFGWDKIDKSRRPVTFFIGSADGRTRTNIILFE